MSLKCCFSLSNFHRTCCHCKRSEFCVCKELTFRTRFRLQHVWPNKTERFALDRNKRIFTVSRWYVRSFSRYRDNSCPQSLWIIREDEGETVATLYWNESRNKAQSPRSRKNLIVLTTTRVRRGISAPCDLSGFVYSMGNYILLGVLRQHICLAILKFLIDFVEASDLHLSTKRKYYTQLFSLFVVQNKTGYWY